MVITMTLAIATWGLGQAEAQDPCDALPELNPPFVFAEGFDLCIKPGACPSFVDGVERRQRDLPDALADFVPGNNDANGLTCIVSVGGEIPPVPPDNKDHNRHHGGGGGGGGGVIGPNFADQTLESGEIETETNISIEGNNNNQCAGLLQFGNTGNVANQQGTLQYFTAGGDNEFEGPETSFAPENETGCDQAAQQSSAASSWGDG